MTNGTARPTDQTTDLEAFYQEHRIREPNHPGSIFGARFDGTGASAIQTVIEFFFDGTQGLSYGLEGGHLVIMETSSRIQYRPELQWNEFSLSKPDYVADVIERWLRIKWHRVTDEKGNVVFEASAEKCGLDMYLKFA